MNYQFTKKQRHDVYVHAKKLYVKNQVKKEECTINEVCEWTIPAGKIEGMCEAISWAVDDVLKLNTYFNTTFDTLDSFPELYAISPKNAVPGKYWWDVMDTKIRLSMFDKLINETKDGELE